MIIFPHFSRWRSPIQNGAIPPIRMLMLGFMLLLGFGLHAQFSTTFNSTATPAALGRFTKAISLPTAVTCVGVSTATTLTSISIETSGASASYATDGNGMLTSPAGTTVPLVLGANGTTFSPNSLAAFTGENFDGNWIVSFNYTGPGFFAPTLAINSIAITVNTPQNLACEFTAGAVIPTLNLTVPTGSCSIDPVPVPATTGAMCSNLAITYAINGAPAAAVAGGATTISPSLSPGTHTIEWTVTNSCNQTSIATQNIVIVDNQAPVFTACPTNTALTLGAGECASNYTYNVAAADNCSDFIQNTSSMSSSCQRNC